jgi:hypothetical protein
VYLVTEGIFFGLYLANSIWYWTACCNRVINRLGGTGLGSRLIVISLSNMCLKVCTSLSREVPLIAPSQCRNEDASWIDLL